VDARGRPRPVRRHLSEGAGIAPTTGLLILYAKCIRAGDEPAWDEWEDMVHLPALCRVGGPWVATRFELTQRPEPGMPGIGFTHVTICELDDDDVAGQAALTLDAEDALRTSGDVHAAHVAIGADVFRAHGPYGTKPEPSPALRGHILTNVLCNDPAHEAEWDAWYDDQHVPDMLSCGAFGALSRWQRTPRARVGSNFLTLYDISAATVDEAVERSAVTLAEITAAGRKHETHAGALTVTLQPTGRYGGHGFRRPLAARWAGTYATDM
jgi:hypothetical protein